MASSDGQAALSVSYLHSLYGQDLVLLLASERKGENEQPLGLPLSSHLHSWPASCRDELVSNTALAAGCFMGEPVRSQLFYPYSLGPAREALLHCSFGLGGCHMYYLTGS